jgi:RES domain-containing protein
VVSRVAWRPAYRIIDSRFPFVGIWDRIADPAEIEAVVAFEALTNERILDEIGTLALVRREDRISGPGTTPIMAAFTHARSSRFSDGTFGVYYAARRRETAIAEVRHHKTRFLQNAHEASIDLDMRLYAADVEARCEDLRRADDADPRLDPNAYDASQTFGRALSTENRVDGVVYRSVRDRTPRAECVAIFRPRCITHCVPVAYLTFRWDGRAIVEVHVKAEILRFPDAASP